VSSPRVAQSPPPLGLPIEARVVYNRADNAMLGLVEVDGRTLLVSPELVSPARVEKTSAGYLLHAARVAEPLEREPWLPIPEMLELTKPTAANPRWQLDAGVQGRFAELPDPWAIRLSAGLERLELEHVDLHGFEVLERLRQYAHLLRDQPAKELAEIASGFDPNWIKSKGGVNAYVAEQLWMELEELRPAVAKGEQSLLERYIEIAKAVAHAGGTLWPPNEDAFLAKLAERLAHTDAKVTIRDGALMSVDTKDRKGVPGCDLGIMLPEPTENHGHPWAPFTPPAAGKLGAFTYVMFVVQSGLPATCDHLRPRDFAYPVRHGVYYFRLFSDARANVRGALFIGYMGAELYVIKGASEKELMAMLGANSEEISNQAE
jgi:hypothetical protein